MQAKFELTEQDYRYLFDNASDAIWVHDMEGNFLDANKAFEKLSGCTLEDWAHIKVTEFLIGAALVLAREVKHKLLGREDLEQPYEQRFVLKDDFGGGAIEAQDEDFHGSSDSPCISAAGAVSSADRMVGARSSISGSSVRNARSINSTPGTSAGSIT